MITHVLQRPALRGRFRRAFRAVGSIVGSLSVAVLAQAEDRAVENTLPPDQSFQKVTLNGTPGQAMGLTVLPDGRVLHTTRDGRVLAYDPNTGFNTVAAALDVYQHDEEGLQAVAIDPYFERNHWVYIYYSPALSTPVDDPATPDDNEGDAPRVGGTAEFARFRGVMRLSRFELRERQLLVASEQIILEVPTDRGICCHVGGHIDFDVEGNLYLSTGDDTNPFGSDGFAPIDERPGQNPAFDAQRSSANTNDLRGKVLRIRVKPNGGYSIPRGNLFAPGTSKARPEIYAMGLRNPFRFSVNRATGILYLADYGPDALEPNAARGPAGQGRWTIVRAPGNYGWPYCATPYLPYVHYDFATQTAGAPFDCQGPINDSPNNTGRRRLPPVVQPEVWYATGASAEFPELGAGGVAPMAGPAYVFNPKGRSPIKWPRYFDRVPIFYDWARGSLYQFRLDHRGGFDQIAPLLPSFVFDDPIDMQFGPDGALYVLESGTGYLAENPAARLSRVDFVRGNFSPVPVLSARPLLGRAPLTVQLSSAGTLDPDGDAVSTLWDFDADGVVDSTDPNPRVTFARDGSYSPALRVVDGTGRSATAAVRIVVGNDPPVVEFVSPSAGQAFALGQTVAYEVAVSDDQPVDCARVSVTYLLGRAQRSQPLSTARGCRGSFEIQRDAAGQTFAERLAPVLVASYADAPAQPGAPSLLGQAVVVLSPPIAGPR